MGDAAGDIGPGRRALRRDEIGDVVERHYVAARLALRLLTGDADGNGALATAAHKLDLLLQSALASLGLGEQGGDLRHHIRQRLADEFLGREPQRPLRARIGDGDDAVGIDAEHARRDPREHGLGEAAAPVDQVVGRPQAVVLAAQLLRHGVEALAEMGEIAVRFPRRHAGVEVAGGDLVGGVDEPADRGDEAVGEVQPEPHRREQRDQRDQDEDRGEGDLHVAAQLVEGQVLGRRGAGDAGKVDGELAHLALHQQHGIVVGRHPHQRGEDPALVRQQADRVARFRRILKGGGRGQTRLLEHVDIGAGHHLVGAAHDLDDRQAERLGADRHEALEPLAVHIEIRPGAGQVVGKDPDLAGERLAVVLLIGVRDLHRFEHHVADPVGEAERQADIDRDRGDDGEQDRRQDRDQAEQADDAGVQPRYRGMGAPGMQEDPRLPRDHHDEGEDERRIDREEHDARGRRPRDLDDAGQDQERDRGGNQSRDHDGRTDPARPLRRRVEPARDRLRAVLRGRGIGRRFLGTSRQQRHC